MVRRSLLLVFFEILFCYSANANYAAGGTITYISIGNLRYVVTYHLYRDCTGNLFPPGEILKVSSVSCSYSQSFSMPLTSSLLTFYEPCLMSISTCSGGTMPGFQDMIYRDTVIIPAQCSDWIFSVTECCSSNSFTTLQNPTSQNQYIEAVLDNSIQENNSAVPTTVFDIACANHTGYMNLGELDADGDSLAFSLEDALRGHGTSIIYNTGFSGITPITSSPNISLNSFTGDLSLYPTDTTQLALISIKVLEYRAGNFIGYTMINFPIFFIDCLNHDPGLFNPPPFIVSTEAGLQYCVDFISEDPDTLDSLVMHWNQGIPTATFWTNGQYRPIGHFCWTPSIADTNPIPHYMTVTVRDSHCPWNYESTDSFGIIVTPFTLIPKVSNDDELNIFPNPTSGTFTMHFDSALRSRRIEIRDVLGNIIFSEVMNISSTNCSKQIYLDTPAGVYFVKVLDGETFLTAKIIIQN